MATNPELDPKLVENQQPQVQNVNLEVNINEKKGEILNFRSDLKSSLYAKIDDVSSRASAKNIEFNIDSEIRSEVDKAVNTAATVVTKLGKRIFPQTETLEEVQITAKTTSSNSSGSA